MPHKPTYHPCDDVPLKNAGIDVTDAVRARVAEIGLGAVLQEKHLADEKAAEAGKDADDG